MRYRPIIAVALSVLASPASTMASGPQQPAPTPPVKRFDSDSLLNAYKQSINDASHGRYVDASYGLLRKLGIERVEETADPDVVDQWAQVMSTMTGVPTFNTAKGPDFHVPEDQISELRLSSGVPAIQEIVRRARHTRIVILDENHLDPRGRAFGLEVARALRPLGYTVLAAEALKRAADDDDARQKMAQLTADGYSRQSSGYYLDDPVFADFIRQSLALGYRPVTYEKIRTDYSTDAKVAQEQREQDQADNIVTRAVRAYPDAKILIYAGEHHAAERPIAAEGGTLPMMAGLLKRATGIDPLTIDQAGLSPVPMNRPDIDLHKIAAPKAARQSVVLMRHGRPVTVGLLAGSVDLQVVHPPVRMTKGRPVWLAGMARHRASIPATLLPSSGTRLVQAFISSGGEDAIPVDQVLVTQGKPVPTLLLPKARVRYAVQNLPEIVE
ncbi:hypothetical protein [Sphingomonas nostoxanthinifaciens]|uniref:hypothetical protein n=1 Tax=Sphingomonas nostoxanthinifaciens TaxID=2872652 RepID=UPI001CC20DF4|nr:hypothetical protein [Sphingomonas nostoxanthinifaciens]UAK25485.1 hypothetical protein K8P63_04765 [Sphingomonas nostoxanthinifaciens]